MQTSVIGREHNANQDFVISGENYGLIADGCSSSKYSEVGTRLVLQLYGGLPTCNDAEKFEENITHIMDKVIDFFKDYAKTESDGKYATSLLNNNFFFTLLACFEKENEYVVYMLGDGYIITQNKHGEFSYIHSSYENNMPSYIIYNYLFPDKNIPFKKYVFDKDKFIGVGVATDGIEPIVNEVGFIGKDGGKKKFESYLANTDNLPEKRQIDALTNFIKRYSKTEIYDDTTIYFVGGNKNG